ncbi:phospholipase D-like domain-containing protein [Leptospira bandrabouensis]|uniref:phospholipase D n=1 Tax=Leptospira bandrabouensis TaxID=2484903 RepID=A0A6H3NS78_9LEPT|nr:phospholipase D-like domain-containing protein [Leptospira bandrabouensis]MCG6153019.1 phospholipase D-like domain-containing protein [Leptospira bandrabouensis]TGN03821.1 PLD-like domain protein [Leptospira bandrabouensis]TGN12153.1 PLD-like domain protein [Leptospira bandrabouensis]
MKKHKRIRFLLFALLFLFCHKPKQKIDLSWLLLPTSPISDLYFSYPGRHVAEDKKRIVKEALISEIRKAKVSIHAYLYSIDDYEILSELYLKKRMGLDIQLYGDKEEEYSELQSFGLEIKRWSGSGIHHTKIWIFDGARLFTGTGNFTTHGLYTDHNVFWAQNISKEEVEFIHSTLLGTNPRGFFRIGSLFYWVSPEAGLEIQQELIDAVVSAKHSIKYLIYSHYDPVLSLKLIEASKRGVRVEGIYNAPIKSSNPEGVFLSQNLEPPSQIYEDGNVDFIYKNDRYLGGLLHHKTMIVDDRIVYTGSYNYSVSARDKNKEIFVKMDHPSIAEEFLGEWKRVLWEAQPISKSLGSSNDADGENENSLRMYSLRQYQNSLFQTNILFNSEGIFDTNSNALSNAYKQSLGLVGVTRPKWGNRFESTFIGEDPIWEESEGENLHLYFQNYFLGTKVSLSSGEKILSFSIWDGSHSKENFVLDSNSTLIGKTDFWKGKNLWIWIQTENRKISFCQVKGKTSPPEWMVFLKNRLETLGKIVPICTSG